MRFSQRIGKTSIRENIQIESIDERLENRLWNIILNNYFDKYSDEINTLVTPKKQICSIIWKEYFGKRIDEIPRYYGSLIHTPNIITFFKEYFFDSQWYEKYDFIEFLSTAASPILNLTFCIKCNEALKKEMAGYRIINQSIVEITSEEEIVEIEEALNNSSKWQPVNIHLKASVDYFSNRENPDYRNSIKEAISSIESLCIIITGDNDTTLHKALVEIEKDYNIHGALKSAFSSLYGYTSDAGGIRHALLTDNVEVTMEDAKFMLVSCSAFINYLKVKIEK